MKSKFNIGLKLSRNFQTVTCEFVEEELEFDSPEEMKAKIRQKFEIAKSEIELQFDKLAGGKK
jgi:predicted translin family RNA/ssDNA-binding protein